MPKSPPFRTPKTTLALEVDRLLKQLPGGDPTLLGDREPSEPPRTRQSGSFSVGTARTAPPPAVPSVRAQHLISWLGALFSAGLGAAVAQWPYARECGWVLYLYLGVIGVLLVTAGWSSVAAWRVRSAGSHVLSLIVVFWGIVLAAEQILTRIGYSAQASLWACVG